MQKLHALLILFTLFGFKPAPNKISSDRISEALVFCQKNNMNTSVAITALRFFAKNLAFFAVKL